MLARVNLYDILIISLGKCKYYKDAWSGRTHLEVIMCLVYANVANALMERIINATSPSEELDDNHDAFKNN